MSCIMRPLRRYSQPAAATGELHAAPSVSQPRTAAVRSSHEWGAPLDFSSRSGGSGFDRRERGADAPNRFSFDRDGDRGDRPPRRFGDRGRDSDRPTGRRDSRRNDEFYGQPLVKETDDAPYSPPAAKFTTNPAWVSDEERLAWLKSHNVRMFGDNIPISVKSWSEVGLPKEFMSHLIQFQSPSLIQSVALPIAIAGRDMIGIAETGSGKTLAFAIPALASFYGETVRPRFPRVVVLAPTRELAVQTAKVFDELGASLGVRTACVYGGASASHQIQAISRGAGVIVATPGRLTDLVRSGHVNLSAVTYAVLDEADRMLDMGFAPQIDTILQAFPRKHQTLMFSATWPKEIRTLAAQYLQQGVRVQIGSEEMIANPRIKQVVEVFDSVPTLDQRLDRLSALLEEYHVSKQKKNKIIVFVNTKHDADAVVDYLAEKNFRVSALHGDFSQNQRDRAMAQFKQGRVPILVATDVAARGLDVPDVEYVINMFFPPGDIDQYVHRIGRTGRAGLSGVAHTFFTPLDGAKKSDLMDILERAKQPIPPTLMRVRNAGNAGRRGGGGGGGGGGGRRYGGGNGGNRRFGSGSRGGGERREWNRGGGEGGSGSGSGGGRYESRNTGGFDGGSFDGKL